MTAYQTTLCLLLADALGAPVEILAEPDQPIRFAIVDPEVGDFLAADDDLTVALTEALAAAWMWQAAANNAQLLADR